MNKHWLMKDQEKLPNSYCSSATKYGTYQSNSPGVVDPGLA
jgi:hypothetical protein